jgi:phosphopantetheine--protein transferase-like protein
MDGSAGIAPVAQNVAALDAVAGYVSRLMGEAVTADQPLALRSIHRVALASWARQEGLNIRGDLLTSGAPFSIRELTGGGAAAARPGAPAAPAPRRAMAGSTAIGIDIEDVASLPVTDDYREHPFFRDNFTPAEISYCLRQPDARAALCGTWAAKEAVLKAGAPGAALMRLIEVEITRDEMGRPRYAGCTMSISHTGQTAVAVCLRQAPPAAVTPIPPAEMVAPAAPPAARRNRRGALAGLIALLIAAGFVIYCVSRSSV